MKTGNSKAAELIGNLPQRGGGEFCPHPDLPPEGEGTFSPSPLRERGLGDEGVSPHSRITFDIDGDETG